MNASIKVLLIIGGYLLIALVLYFILYWKTCKNYKTNSYTNLENYMEREEGYLCTLSAFWPFLMVMTIVLVPIDFIKNKIRKHYEI